MQTIRQQTLLSESIKRQRTNLHMEAQAAAISAHLSKARRAMYAEEVFDEEFSPAPLAWYWIAAWFAGFGLLFAFAWLGG